MFISLHSLYINSATSKAKSVVLEKGNKASYFCFALHILAQWIGANKKTAKLQILMILNNQIASEYHVNVA